MRKFMVGLVVLVASTAVSQASVTMYTSLASYNAATQNNTTITFNGIAPAGSFVGYGTGPLNLSGVSFTGNGSMFVIDPGYYGFPYTGGGFLTSDYTQPNIITATLPANITAVGTNYGSLFSGGTTFTITLSSGEVFVLPVAGSTANNNLSFVGFTSTSPISFIRYSSPDGGNYNALDNFVFGQAVPEPMSMLVFGGLVAVGGVVARRRMAKVSA